MALPQAKLLQEPGRAMGECDLATVEGRVGEHGLGLPFDDGDAPLDPGHVRGTQAKPRRPPETSCAGFRLPRCAERRPDGPLIAPGAALEASIHAASGPTPGRMRRVPTRGVSLCGGRRRDSQ